MVKKISCECTIVYNVIDKLLDPVTKSVHDLQFVLAHTDVQRGLDHQSVKCS